VRSGPEARFTQGARGRADRVRALHLAIGMNRRTQQRSSTAAKQVDRNDPGELIGRRTGRGDAALGRVMAGDKRDENRDKPGGVATARRNAKVRAPRATAMLEDSRTKPSRKSTRRSANRVKSGQEQAKTEKLRTHTPSARAQARRH